MDVVLEGSLKFRDGKKWKPRWCTIRKLSPAADRLYISLYKSARSRFKNGQEKNHLPVENFYGVSSGIQLDREQHVMAIVCRADTILLAFESKETLNTWQIAVRSHLGEEKQFSSLKLIRAPGLSKLPGDTVSLFIQADKFCLSSGTPPRVIATWLLSDICKFGIVEDKFCFQAGNQCKRFAGVFVLGSEEATSITACLKEVSSQTKASRSRLNSSSSSRNSSSSLTSSQRTGSLPQNLQRKNFSNPQVNADHNFITESSRPHTAGLVRCATVSEADRVSHPKPQCVRQVTQSTPNFQRKTFEKIEEGLPSPTDSPVHSTAPAYLTDSFKSRRYSSGDIYLSKLKQKRQSKAARQAELNKTVSELKSSPPSKPRTQRSQSQVDINDFYNQLGRNVNVLGAKLARPAEWRGRGCSASSASITCYQVASQQLDLKSHGHGRGYMSNSSLNLSQILQSCSLSSDENLSLARAIKARSTSSVSSSCGARDLNETPTVTCKVGSLSDIRLSPKQRCIHSTKSVSGSAQPCNKCSKKDSVHSKSASNIASDPQLSVPQPSSSSVSRLSTCSSGPIGSETSMRLDEEAHSLSTDHSHCHSSGASFSTQSAARSIPSMANGQVNPDQSPRTPLQYIDLTRFDGVDDEYINCLNARSSTEKRDPSGTVPEYQNVPVSHHKPARDIKEAVLNHSSAQVAGQENRSSPRTSTPNKFLSIHGSLRRPQDRGVVQAFNQWDQNSVEQSRCNAGEYVRLRDKMDNPDSLPPRPTRKPRGGSLENILENDRVLPDSLSGMSGHPGSDLSAVVPIRHASLSKDDLMEALAKQAATETGVTRNSVADSQTSDSSNYQPMGLMHRQVPKPQDAPGMIREAEYVDMNGKKSRDDNTVFCSVDLPPKCTSSDTWNRTSSFSSPSGNNQPHHSLTDAHSVPIPLQQDDPYMDMSSTRPSLRSAATEPSYLDMSYGQRKTSLLTQSSSPSKHSPLRTGKPTLLHSKSLDNELDEPPYLDMNPNRRQSSAEYLVMNQVRSANKSSNSNADAALYANTTPLKPFDNLIRHRSYTKTGGRDGTSSSAGSIRTGDNNSCNGDKSSSEDDNSSQKSGKSNKKSSSKSGSKTANLFTRIIKRSSLKSKDKSKLKQSRSTQEFSSYDPKTSATQDRRLSMQNPTGSSSGSFPRFTIGESDSVSSSSSNVATSTPSGSPNNSGLVTLSQWKIGGGSPAHRPLQGQDLITSTGVRASSNNSIHHYVNDIAATAPPVLPPKTYKGNVNSQLKLEAQVQGHEGRRLSSHSKDGESPQPSPSYMEMSNNGTKIHERVPINNASRVSDHVPPPLPEKSRNGKTCKKQLSTVNEHVEEGAQSGACSLDRSRSSLYPTDEDDDVFLDNVPPPTYRSASVLPPGECVRPRKNPNLTVAIPGTSGENGRHHHRHGRGRNSAGPATADVCQGGETSEGRGFRSCPPCGAAAVDERHAPRHKQRAGSTRSTASSSSCDSCDTHSTYDLDSAQHVSSPAFTTMKPRFGKEYTRIDKKKLAGELNMPLPGQSSISHSTEPSPSVGGGSSVFNFDLAAIKSRQSSTSSYSMGEAGSPKYPISMGSSRHSRDPAYVNLSFSRTNSPVIIENTPPPQSPGARSNLSDNSDVLLNYAEIDLSDSCKGKKSSRPIPRKGTVNYAVIDMVATTALSQVGREQAALREDNMRKCYDSHDRLSNSSGSHTDRHADRPSGSVTLPTRSSREKRTSLGRSNSTSSRDRKM